MFKEFLQNSIIKDLKLIKRLAGKIPHDQMSFRPKPGLRSTEELLQYLTFASTSILEFWLNKHDHKDFRAHFAQMNEQAKAHGHHDFQECFDKQIASVNHLFSMISEEDLRTVDVASPSGATFKLGEGILETTIKWLAAYKMQLFLYIKMSTDLQLSTPDLWRKVED